MALSQRPLNSPSDNPVSSYLALTLRSVSGAVFPVPMTASSREKSPVTIGRVIDPPTSASSRKGPDHSTTLPSVAAAPGPPYTAIGT